MPTKKDDLKELSKLSGENQIRKHYFSVPTLKFNGSKNQWSLLTKEEPGKFDVKDIEAPTVTILKIRRRLAAYEKATDGNSVRWFTNEHDAWNDQLTLFKKSKNDTRSTVVAEGGIDDMKAQNPNLKLNFVLYCLYDSEIHRLTIKGKSLASFFEYLNDISANNHVFEKEINLTSHEETNEGGLVYYVVDFEAGKASDMKIVAKAINFVNDELNQSEAPAKKATKNVVVDNVSADTEKVVSEETSEDVESLPY